MPIRNISRTCSHATLQWPDRPTPRRRTAGYYWRCRCADCGAVVFRSVRTETLRTRYPDLYARAEARRQTLGAQAEVRRRAREVDAAARKARSATDADTDAPSSPRRRQRPAWAG